MLAALKEINNCYILQSKVGEDSCTELWAASAIYSPRRFILRFIKDSALFAPLLERFRGESFKYYMLKNDAVEDLIEIESFENRLFISTENHGDVSLSESSDSKRFDDLIQVCDAITHVASGFEVFHKHGIVYGGFTPENILVSGTGKECVFRIRTPGYSPFMPVCINSVSFSPDSLVFLPKEAALADKLSPASDIYSLGVLLAWFLAGDISGAAGLGKEVSVSACLSGLLRQKSLPDDLIKIVTRCVQDNPGKRYQACQDLLYDVAKFADAARKASAAGIKAPDSMTPMRAKPQRAALPEAVPRPEVAKYFQELSADYRGGNAAASAIQALAAPKAAAVVSAPEKSAVLPVEKASPEAQTVKPFPIISPALDEPPVDAEQAEDVAFIEGPQPDAPHFDAQNFDAPMKAADIRWNYRKMRFDDVTTTLIRSVRRARSGKGDVRYIEEPDTEAAGDAIDDMFEGLSREALCVDIGSMLRFGTADVTDFLCAFRQALARKLIAESSRSLGRFARIVERIGARDFFGAYPLGRLLYGTDAEEHMPEPESYDAIIEAMTVFGRRKIPLVFIVRGGECIQSELAEFFGRMVAALRKKPVCLFVFGEDFPSTLRIFKGN